MEKQPLKGHRFLPFKEINAYIVEAIEQGYTRKEIAGYYNVSLSYITEISLGQVKGVRKPATPVVINLSQEDYKHKQEFKNEKERKLEQVEPKTKEGARSVQQPATSVRADNNNKKGKKTKAKSG